MAQVVRRTSASPYPEEVDDSAELEARVDHLAPLVAPFDVALGVGPGPRCLNSDAASPRGGGDTSMGRGRTCQGVQIRA